MSIQLWDSIYDSSVHADDIPDDASYVDKNLVHTERNYDLHPDLMVNINYWRNGGWINRDSGEDSFIQMDIPDISSSVSSMLDSSTRSSHDWPRGFDAYNFVPTSWFSCLIEGSCTSYFIAEGDTEYHEVAMESVASTAWGDGFCRLPRVAHKRVHSNNCVFFCLIPKIVDGTRISTPYKYKQFVLSSGDSFTTNVENSSQAHLMAIKGRLNGKMVIAYDPSIEHTHTADSDCVVVSITRID